MIGGDSSGSNATLPTNNSSIAARMLHRKSQIDAQNILPHNKRDKSVDSNKLGGSNKLTNRELTSGRNQKS